jgi:hypothetical protein
MKGLSNCFKVLIAPGPRDCKGMVFAVLSQSSGKWPDLRKVFANHDDEQKETCP